MKSTSRTTAPLSIERAIWAQGYDRVAGVDEAGRGPLAGPVVAAAVVFPRGFVIRGVRDSKTLTARERERLCVEIRSAALSVSVGIVDHQRIDQINILQASLEAMRLAVDGLSVRPQILLVDGPVFVSNGLPYRAVVDGDARCFTIAAASIVAKVERDRMMLDYDRMYPVYGFGKHKGYPTRQHVAAIRSYGLCPIHRRSFRCLRDPAEASSGH